MTETLDRVRKKRRPRTTTMLNMRVSDRTAGQWARCRAIGKLLGMGADEVLARAMNHALLDMQREVRKQTPSIDWASVYAEASRKRGQTALNPVNYAPRTPRVDS